LHDIGLVRHLQRISMPLAIEHALTHPQQPLWIALTAPWPWAGVGIATFVLDAPAPNGRLAGFVQLMKRVARPEADLLHLAPALVSVEPDGATAAAWQALLSHCSVAAASHGLQRIYASTPAGCPEQACLKEAGFRFYVREMIYRLAAAPQSPAPPAGFRAQLPQDSWAFQRLYTRDTPRLVQQAEGSIAGEVGSPLLSWWEPDRWQGIVWEPAGEVRGAVQAHLGRTGHWLRVWGANNLTPRDLRGLVEQGLRLIDMAPQPRRRRSLPVYATVRDYEAGLGSTLTGFGFAPFMDRARFVRHTTVMLREPHPAPLTALEARGEVPAASRPMTINKLASSWPERAKRLF
jgi:hypothetical protein